MGGFQPSGDLKACERNVGKDAGQVFETPPQPSWSQLVVTNYVQLTTHPFKVCSALGVKTPSS